MAPEATLAVRIWIETVASSNPGLGRSAARQLEQSVADFAGDAIERERQARVGGWWMAGWFGIASAARSKSATQMPLVVGFPLASLTRPSIDDG